MKDIHTEWQNSTPRRIALSGLGGVGKTELSISIVNKLGPKRYVLWLRACDEDKLQQDLVTAAEDLRNELMRFNIDNELAIGEDRRGAAFYFSPVSVSDLVNILKRWLRSSPDDNSRILVVLDDLDGLDPELHEKYSLLFSGHALDLIYTTRDPWMADPGMFWEAFKFDVPSLEIDEAVNILEHVSRDHRPTTQEVSGGTAVKTSILEGETTRKVQMQKVATRLGALPAAIILGSHYIKDSLGSKWNVDRFQEFLELWDSDGGNPYHNISRSNILTSHRAMLKYRHSMLSSFRVSVARLGRNVHIVEEANNDVADIDGSSWPGESGMELRARAGISDTRKAYCLQLLELLSAMDLCEISQNDLSAFKSALFRAKHDVQGNLRRVPEFSDVTSRPQQPNYGISINDCISELIKVSLLTERPTDGTIVLNNVTKACALLVPTSISPEDRVAVRDSAKKVWIQWKRKSFNEKTAMRFA